MWRCAGAAVPPPVHASRSDRASGPSQRLPLRGLITLEHLCSSIPHIPKRAEKVAAGAPEEERQECFRGFSESVRAQHHTSGIFLR